MEGSLEELRAKLTDVDDRLVLKIAEKDEAQLRVESIKNELRALNAERDPLAEEVAVRERAERASAGVPITNLGDGTNG